MIRRFWRWLRSQPSCPLCKDKGFTQSESFGMDFFKICYCVLRRRDKYGNYRMLHEASYTTHVEYFRNDLPSRQECTAEDAMLLKLRGLT